MDELNVSADARATTLARLSGLLAGTLGPQLRFRLDLTRWMVAHGAVWATTPEGYRMCGDPVCAVPILISLSRGRRGQWTGRVHHGSSPLRKCPPPVWAITLADVLEKSPETALDSHHNMC